MGVQLAGGQVKDAPGPPFYLSPIRNMGHKGRCSPPSPSPIFLAQSPHIRVRRDERERKRKGERQSEK